MVRTPTRTPHPAPPSRQGRLLPATAVAGAGLGLAAAGAAAAVLATADSLFATLIDTQSPKSVLRRKEQAAADGRAEAGAGRPAAGTRPVRDAGEQAEAARWFEESRQPVAMRSHDGLRLRAWLVDPDCADPTPHRYAVCCHGYSGGPDEMAKVAHRYARMGFTVMVPAMRAHAPSEGRYVGMGWLDRIDLLGWIRLIVQADPEARILLHGQSMGAAAVMMAAGEASLPRNVVAAVADCGYTSVWDEFLAQARVLYYAPRWLAAPVLAAMSALARCRAGYGFKEASCLRQLRHTTIPMLFVHGGADDVVPVACLERLYEACNSVHREKLLVRGAGHTMSSSVDPMRYWGTVGRFVGEAFDR